MKYFAILALIVLALIVASGCTQSSQPKEIPSPQTTATPIITATKPPVTSTTPGSPLPTQTPAGKPSGLLTVSFLDVGQGDAMLIQTASGKNMLIDAGPTDAGSTVVSDLKGLGVNTLDVVLATHPHEDHIGGMSSVLNNFNVKQFIDIGFPQTTKTYETMLNTIDQKNIPYKTVKAGDTINLDPGLTISILNPPSTFSDDINQNSIVLKVTYGGVSFLLMGDANSDAETRIANSGTNLQADILKVGHHGSATSSSSAFLTKVHPKSSIIEVGAGNPYGHPTAATLGRLAQEGSAVYRTDLNGDITVTTDGTTYNVKSGKTSSQPVVGTGSVPAKTVTTQQTVSTQSSTGVVCDCSSNLYNCKDFSGHDAAQACYDYCISLGKGDIHQLDGDKNGIACEG